MKSGRIEELLKLIAAEDEKCEECDFDKRQSWIQEIYDGGVDALAVIINFYVCCHLVEYSESGRLWPKCLVDSLKESLNDAKK